MCLMVKLILKVYKKLDNSAEAAQFWIDIETVAEENVKSLEKEEQSRRRFDKRDGIAKSVKSDILKIFQ